MLGLESVSPGLGAVEDDRCSRGSSNVGVVAGANEDDAGALRTVPGNRGADGR